MSRHLVRLLLLVCACAALGLTACGSSDEQGGPSTSPSRAEPTTLSGGSTTLAIDPQTVGQLSDNELKATPVAPATGSGSAITFPISSGVLDATTLSGTVQHRGGLRLASDVASIVLRDLRMDTHNRQVTADAGHGRLPVFDLDQRKLTGSSATGELRASGVVATLTPRATRELNAALQVQAFTPRQIIGDVTISATTG